MCVCFCVFCVCVCVPSVHCRWGVWSAPAYCPASWFWLEVSSVRQPFPDSTSGLDWSTSAATNTQLPLLKVTVTSNSTGCTAPAILTNNTSVDSTTMRMISCYLQGVSGSRNSALWPRRADSAPWSPAHSIHRGGGGTWERNTRRCHQRDEFRMVSKFRDDYWLTLAGGLSLEPRTFRAVQTGVCRDTNTERYWTSLGLKNSLNLNLSERKCIYIDLFLYIFSMKAS